MQTCKHLPHSVLDAISKKCKMTKRSAFSLSCTPQRLLAAGNISECCELNQSLFDATVQKSVAFIVYSVCMHKCHFVSDTTSLLIYAPNSLVMSNSHNCKLSLCLFFLSFKLTLGSNSFVASEAHTSNYFNIININYVDIITVYGNSYNDVPLLCLPVV